MGALDFTMTITQRVSYPLDSGWKILSKLSRSDADRLLQGIEPVQGIVRYLDDTGYHPVGNKWGIKVTNRKGQPRLVYRGNDTYFLLAKDDTQ